MLLTAVALLALAAATSATNFTAPGCGGRVWCEFVGRFVFAELMETSNQAIEGSSDLSAVFIQLADTNKNNRVNFQEFLDFTEGYIRRAFAALDSDGNDLVSKAEAEGTVTKAKFGLIESILSELFSLADLDGDGQLSTKDLPMGKKNKLDTNGDGAVSIKELLGHPVIFFPRPIQSVYKQLDSDKDETISNHEFTNFINFIGRLFNVLDTNSDCSVSLDESLQALDDAGLPKDFQLAVDLSVRPYIALARYAILTGIEAADENTDGSLSLSEVLDFKSANFIETMRSLILPIYIRKSPVPLLYLAGKRDMAGVVPSNKEEEKAWFNKALAAWLSTFQGFISQPTFSTPRPSCN